MACGAVEKENLDPLLVRYGKGIERGGVLQDNRGEKRRRYSTGSTAHGR